MAKKLPLVKLQDLQPGQFADFFAQLAEKTRGQTRDGKPYYALKFRDPKRTAAAMVWADSPHFEACQTEWQPGEFFKVRGTFGEHPKYGPQVEVEQLRPVADRDRADGFDEADFVDRSRSDPEQTFANLVALVTAEVKDEPLRRLTLGLLEQHAAALKPLPAHEKRHYPFAGGWLEHALHVAQNGAWLADRYRDRFPDLTPPLNRDLVIAGAVLQDIGRVTKLEAGPPGQPMRVGVAGELLGQLFLGYDLIRAAARDIPDLSPELLDLLLHILVSRRRLPEWGAPRLPCIPEALIVHHADELDAELELFARCITRGGGDGPFTDRDPVLGRVLLKGRTV